MLGLENTEEILQILDRFTKLKLKAIPKELEDYLGYVAKTGDPVYNWSTVQYLFREKLTSVIKDFHDTTPSIEELPQCPNVDVFNYENLKTALIERLDMFHAAPFTLQRLCELLTDPKKHYCRLDKYMRALEKNILVVSTIEPGRKQSDSENGDSMPADIMLDSDVEKDMTGMSDSNKSFADNSAKTTVSTPVATASSSDSRKETENGTTEEEDIDTDLPNDVVVAEPAPNVIEAELSLDVILETKDDAKLIDVEGGSDLLDDSIADSSQDAEPHIDVVDDVKDKDPIAIEPEASMELSDKPVEMSVAEPTVDEPASELLKAVETIAEPIEMLLTDVDDATKDAEMEEELLAEPVADINTAPVVIAPVVEATVETVEITASTISPVEKIEFEDENDFIFEPRSSKIPRLDIADISLPTDSLAGVIAPTEAKEAVATLVEEPTTTSFVESGESTAMEDAAPIVEEPVSSPLGPSEKISSHESIEITEVAESDKTEFSAITTEPVINEPYSVTSPEPIKEPEHENPTEISTTTDTPVEDILTPAASEVSDAILVAEPVAPVEEVPVDGTPAIIPETISPQVTIPEKTEEMSVEEVETTASVATSDSAMDAAPINPPVVEEIAAVIAPAIALETAIPNIVTAEDEQMEVDETNSTDPMDL